jgi:hypothetical protein
MTVRAFESRRRGDQLDATMNYILCDMALDYLARRMVEVWGVQKPFVAF